MPENVEELIEEQEDDSDLIKSLRKHIKKLNGENKDLRHTNLIHEAGLSELTPRQIRAAIKSFDEGEKVDKDTLRAAADELGFLKKAEASTTSTDNGDGGSDGGKTPPDPSTSTTTTTEPDPVAESLKGLSQQEMATVMSMRGGGAQTTQEDFLRRLTEAKDPEAAKAIISHYGPSVGIMLDSDLI